MSESQVNGTVDKTESPNKVSTFVFLDFEATGLKRPRVTELCLLAVSRLEIETGNSCPRVINKLVLCLDPKKPIDHVASSLTGLYNDGLEHQSPWNDNVVDLISLFLRRLTSPVCLVAHNGNRFDFPLLQSELTRINRSLEAHISCADSLEAFRELDGLPRQYVPRQNWQSPLSATAKTPPTKIHQAAGPPLLKRKSIDSLDTDGDCKIVKIEKSSENIDEYKTNTCMVKKKLDFSDEIADQDMMNTDSIGFSESLEDDDYISALEMAEGNLDQNSKIVCILKIVDKKSIDKRPMIDFDDDKPIEIHVDCDKDNEPIKERDGNDNGPNKEGTGISNEPIKGGSGSGNEPIKEGSGSDTEPIKEGSGSNNEPIKEGSRSGNEPIKEGSRSGNEPIKMQNGTETMATSNLVNKNGAESKSPGKINKPESVISDTQKEVGKNQSAKQTPDKTENKAAGCAVTSGSGYIVGISETHSTFNTASDQTCIGDATEKSSTADNVKNGLASSTPVNDSTKSVTESDKAVSAHENYGRLPPHNTQSPKIETKVGTPITLSPFTKWKSYKLEEIYKRVFGTAPDTAHNAETDCLMLMKIVTKTSKFLDWVDKNAIRLSSIEPMK